MICSHAEYECIHAGVVTVQGYAMTGGDWRITRVNLSCDGGETWLQAELTNEAQDWSCA